MRILFISTSIPLDMRTCVNGIYNRMRMFIDAIKDFAQIDMLFYAPEWATPILSNTNIQNQLSHYWNADLNVFLYPLSQPDMQRSSYELYARGILNFFQQEAYQPITTTKQVLAFKECLNRSKPDAIFVHRLHSACPVLLSKEKLPPVFFDLDDIEHVAFLRNLRQPPFWPGKYLLYLQTPSLIWGERKAISISEQTYVCSDSDKEYLQRSWHLPNIVTIPNAIDLHQMQPLVSDHTLLFLGTYRYDPNIFAAEYLIQNVFPLIRQAIPDAQLIIAGNNPENIKSYTANIHGVEFTGFVDNLTQLYQRARVVCSPVFSGGGTRTKIIEAATFGKPIVANKLGCEGLDMRDGCDMLIRDDAHSFAKACIKLLLDDDLCRLLGSNAHSTSTQKYDRSVIVRKIRQNILDYLS